MPARLKNPTLDALARGSKTVRVTERDHPSGNTLTGFLSAMGSCLWVTNGYMEMHFLEEEVELISTTVGDSEVDAVITLRPYKE